MRSGISDTLVLSAFSRAPLPTARKIAEYDTTADVFAEQDQVVEGNIGQTEAFITTHTDPRSQKRHSEN